MFKRRITRPPFYRGASSLPAHCAGPAEGVVRRIAPAGAPSIDRDDHAGLGAVAAGWANLSSAVLPGMFEPVRHGLFDRRESFSGKVPAAQACVTGGSACCRVRQLTLRRDVWELVRVRAPGTRPHPAAVRQHFCPPLRALMVSPTSVRCDPCSCAIRRRSGSSDALGVGDVKAFADFRHGDLGETGHMIADLYEFWERG